MSSFIVLKIDLFHHLILIHHLSEIYYLIIQYDYFVANTETFFNNIDNCICDWINIYQILFLLHNKLLFHLLIQIMIT